PMEPVLERLDPAVAEPTRLTEPQLEALVAFVRHGLTDPRARPERLRHLTPERVPSGEPLPSFAF
ncbi:MAG: hypothetical protein ACOC5B_03330, partial [Myxococcota bacterium]